MRAEESVCWSPRHLKPLVCTAELMYPAFAVGSALIE